MCLVCCPLQHGNSLDTEDGASMLCLAAHKGERDQLRRLVEARVNPNEADYDGRTALHLAASEGNVDCLNYLLTQFANVSPVDRWGGTPLADAIRHKQVAIQEILRTRGGSLPSSDDAAGRLCELAATGNLVDLRVLVGNGVDVNLGDYDARRALHLAASNGHLGTLEFLVSCKDVDVNPVDRLGGTPLEDAYRENQPAVIALLQSHGGVRAHHPSLAERLRERDARAARRLFDKVAHTRAEVNQHQRESAMRDEMGRVTNEGIRLFKEQQTWLDALCLSIHPRGHRTAKAVKASPRPTLPQALTSFRLAFQHFMKRHHALQLLECYYSCRAFANRPILETLSNVHMIYLAKGSPHQLNVPPKEAALISECIESASARMRPDLLLGVERYIESRLEDHLKRFYLSREYRNQSVSRPGRLWRVLTLCRLVRDATLQLNECVLEPLRTIAAEKAVSMIFRDRQETLEALLSVVNSIENECQRVHDCVKKSAAGSKVIYDKNQQRRAMLDAKLGKGNAMSKKAGARRDVESATSGSGTGVSLSAGSMPDDASDEGANVVNQSAHDRGVFEGDPEQESKTASSSGHPDYPTDDDLAS